MDKTKKAIGIKGVALVSVIVVILTLTILAGVLLSLVASQTRLAEHDITRTHSLYATEGVMVRELEKLRRGESSDPFTNIGGAVINVTYNSSTGTLNLSRDYTPIF